MRAMPQLSHSTLPSSRWMSSTVFVAVDRQQPAAPGRRPSARRSANTGSSSRQRLRAEQRREVVADRVREHEVAVGETLHQRRRAEPVRAVVGEVRLAEHEQAGQVAHQVVVDPQPAHRVVDGGVDAHRHLVRVLVGDALVHLEEVAVALLDHVLAEALDRLGRSRGTRRSSAGRRRGRRRPRASSARDATSRGTRLPNAG